MPPAPQQSTQRLTGTITLQIRNLCDPATVGSRYESQVPDSILTCFEARTLIAHFKMTMISVDLVHRNHW